MDNKKSGFKGFILSPIGKVVMIVALYAIIWGIMLLLIETEIPAAIFIMAAIFAFFGWKSLDRITPNIFLIMPVGGWLLYYFIKGALSIVIGMFVAPFVIARLAANAVQETYEHIDD